MEIIEHDDVCSRSGGTCFSGKEALRSDSRSRSTLWGRELTVTPRGGETHLGPTCTLADQAVATDLVTTDYDGEPRGTGANGYPEIGPDECY